ncbi:MULTISPECIES: phage holin, lambda family [Hafnia]|nr:phage holin, lambda family [Hafnia alvei]KFC87635.1 holin [Hafnia alvei ATCC 13337]MCV9379976.1 phage holin, lambda family [Hafnia alvei]MDX6845797.1 phage holin, lambda family [Hafnia alvei]RLR07853.1 phage holin, lambda family [Hafnia alvei ATCC 13337]WQD26816.1 phage holin, lambda family [Hafnia alvei]
MKMHKSPELWAMLMTWIAEHRSEGSYAFIAGLMAILRGIYNGESPMWRRILDAAMCALVAFFIKDLLMLMSFDQKWAYIGSVFIGFLGIDYFSSVLRRVVGSKTGVPPQQ